MNTGRVVWVSLGIVQSEDTVSNGWQSAVQSVGPLFLPVERIAIATTRNNLAATPLRIAKRESARPAPNDIRLLPITIRTNDLRDTEIIPQVFGNSPLPTAMVATFLGGGDGAAE
jgi:hypothetical protein